MLKLLLSPGMLFGLALPAVASCQSKDAGTKHSASVSVADKPVVHHAGDGLQVIERGDTLTWIRLRPDKSRLDTAVYVFKGDSAIRLRPMPQPIAKPASDRLRAIRDQLRKIDAMDADLANILK